MLRVSRHIRIAVLLLVLCSGALVGMSLVGGRLTWLAIIGALCGFIITDHFRVFRIDGLLANIASIVILILAMKDFFPGDSTGKLVSVANLLVYLQTVLMFQEKTPRLVWQIIVLSLLQVVVAAIFSLDFEGGILFLLYFVIAGITMLLQVIFASNMETVRRNQLAARHLQMMAAEENQVDKSAISADVANQQRINNRSPILFFEPHLHNVKPLEQMLVHLTMWSGITIIFTSTMFYLIPRHSKPWFGPDKIEVDSTGFTKAVDLVNHGQITQSHQLIFRASFEDLDSGNAKISDQPYFRGMALSSLVIEDGKTNWRAPLDRVQRGLYEELPSSSQGRGVKLKQVIVLEESADPMIYGVMPVFRTQESAKQLSYCHEISALTRCRADEKIDISPFPYELGLLAKADGTLYKSWPFISNVSGYRQLPMSNDKPQYQWLTSMNKSRYPQLVRNADKIVERLRDNNPNTSRIEIVRAFEEYFLEAGRFHYTLDFRDVKWNPNIDPVEDFVANHRQGHCELFASAMTLMLRSQGIPARLVVGFYGGDYSSLTNSFLVRGKHAHAWVEVYLQPEDCSTEMVETGEAGPGGAWMLADATPPTGQDAFDSGAGAMDLARTMWQDYVLGMDARVNGDQSAPLSIPLLNLLQSLNVENWEISIDSLKNSLDSQAVRYVIIAVIILPFFIPWVFNSFFRSRNSQKKSNKKSSVFRRLVADAISIFSPSLGQWVRDAGIIQSQPTAFYGRMTKLLTSRGLLRKPTQSHREFAREVTNFFSDHPAATMIGSTVQEITEIFNDVRFGKQGVAEDLKEQIDLSLRELEQSLMIDSVVLQNRASVVSEI